MRHRTVRADLMRASAFIAVISIAVVLAVGGVDPASAIAGFLFSVGGMFARNIGTAFDFEFGSSRGSKEKSVLMASNHPPRVPRQANAGAS